MKFLNSNPNFKKTTLVANVQPVNTNILQENYILSQIEKKEQKTEKYVKN